MVVWFQSCNVLIGYLKIRWPKEKRTTIQNTGKKRKEKRSDFPISEKFWVFFIWWGAPFLPYIDHENVESLVLHMYPRPKLDT